MGSTFKGVLIISTGQLFSYFIIFRLIIYEKKAHQLGGGLKMNIFTLTLSELETTFYPFFGFRKEKMRLVKFVLFTFTT